MGLTSPYSAILSALILSALIYVLQLNLALDRRFGEVMSATGAQ